MIWMGPIWNTTSAMEWECDTMTSEGGVFSTKGRTSVVAMPGKRCQVSVIISALGWRLGLKAGMGVIQRGINMS
jgi:hypothetical protein